MIRKGLYILALSGLLGCSSMKMQVPKVEPLGDYYDEKIKYSGKDDRIGDYWRDIMKRMAMEAAVIGGTLGEIVRRDFDGDGINDCCITAVDKNRKIFMAYTTHSSERVNPAEGTVRWYKINLEELAGK